jgi:hypothetical protein
MKQLCALFFISVIAIALIASATMMSNTSVLAKSKDSKAKDAIVKTIGKSVEGKWSKIDLAGYSIFGSNATIFPYNKTVGPVVPPPPLVCEPNEHPDNGKCIPNETPSNITGTVVCLVGDIQGVAVRDGMKDFGCDDVIALGDLTYGSTLDSFVKDYGSNDFKVLRCVIGNHDADEEEKGKAIVKQAKLFCGEDAWWFKVGNATLFVGINTNGNLDTQLGNIQDALMNNQFMSNITSVHFVSHKAICMTPPNSHHKELLKTLCNSLRDYVPPGVRIYFDNGHNHVYAETKDGLTKTIGTGGRSHYECGIDQIWIYCNNKDNGFLAYTIDNSTGATVGHFYGTSGNLIR